MSSEEYITCPFCRCKNLDWYDHDWSGSEYLEYGQCQECGAPLIRIYVFDSIIRDEEADYYE